jgi:hypothetical protein
VTNTNDSHDSRVTSTRDSIVYSTNDSTVANPTIAQ